MTAAGRTASHYLVREVVAGTCETYALDTMQEALELRDICADTPDTLATAFVVFTDGFEEML